MLVILKLRHILIQKFYRLFAKKELSKLQSYQMKQENLSRNQITIGNRLKLLDDNTENIKKYCDKYFENKNYFLQNLL